LTTPLLLAGKPFTPVLFGVLAQCPTCHALVDNHKPAITSHIAWHTRRRKETKSA